MRAHPQAARAFAASRSWSPRSTIAPAYSPIVVAGIVRAARVRADRADRPRGLFRLRLPRLRRFDWHYIATAFGVAALAMLAFQAADIYQVQAFRVRSSQMRAARPSPGRSSSCVLVAAVVLRQVGGMFSRVWLASFYGVGLFALYRLRACSCTASCAAGRAKAGSTAAPSWSAAARPAKR